MLNTEPLWVHGGTVVDGTGSPAFPGVVVLRGGRVAEILPPTAEPEPNTPTLDASGLVVAPGFIDIHTHSDVSVYFDGRAQSKVHQGVTTEVIGNCGYSAYPIDKDHRSQHLDLLVGIGDDPVDATWHDLAGYAEALTNRGIAINVAPLVGHGQLRIAAAGLDDGSLDTRSTATMVRLLEEQLDQGAFGVSTGLTYVPSRYADEAELLALCHAIAKHGGVYATHSRGTQAGRDEAFVLARETGARVQYSHMAINNPQRWGTAHELIGQFDQARLEGLDVTFDVYPYDASASALTQYLPTWVQTGGVTAMSERLTDPVFRRQAVEHVARGWGSGIPWLWDRVVLARTDGLLDTREGDTLEQAAIRAGTTPAELVLDLCQVGGNRVQVVLFYRSDDDVRSFIRTPYATIGSDGSALAYELFDRRPHPRSYGAQTRVLGRYARTLGDLELTEAVHKMTGAVADRIGIKDRGRLTPGMAADVVVFDPETVSDRATYLDPTQRPIGIHQVLVNGETVVLNNSQTAARPGNVLRS